MNNQKEVLRLKEELKIRIQKREKENISLTDEKRKKLDHILKVKSPAHHKMSLDSTNSISERSKSAHIKSISSQDKQL
jgi:hypothetical protein